MPVRPIAIKKAGLVTSVGLSALTSCAAIRAKVRNPTETRFIDSSGEWIMAHQAPLEKSWRGIARLARMSAMAIEESLREIPRAQWDAIPLLLCVAEQERPGRPVGLNDTLFNAIQQETGVRFAPASMVIPHGRVGIAIACSQARKLIYEAGTRDVLVAGADSLLSWATLSVYERDERLLGTRNSDGFMPGEAGAALLIGAPSGQHELRCNGIGFGMERAFIGSGSPLRGDGLTQAIKAALCDAHCEMHDMDYRITDLSGEQYYFKEASLALSRTLRRRKDEFDIWHPAECIGEVGAAAGAVVLATADAACRKAYTRGPAILAHMSNDDGQRAALALRFERAA